MAQHDCRAHCREVAWIPDDAVTECWSCCAKFSLWVRRHHCRGCGQIFCEPCTKYRRELPFLGHAKPVRVCSECVAFDEPAFVSRLCALCNESDGTTPHDSSLPVRVRDFILAVGGALQPQPQPPAAANGSAAHSAPASEEEEVRWIERAVRLSLETPAAVPAAVQPPSHTRVRGRSDPPDDYVCPVCYEVMAEATQCRQGHSLCAACWEECLSAPRTVCPIDNATLVRREHLVPNLALRGAIEQFKRRRAA